MTVLDFDVSVRPARNYLKTEAALLSLVEEAAARTLHSEQRRPYCSLWRRLPHAFCTESQSGPRPARTRAEVALLFLAEERRRGEEERRRGGEEGRDKIKI